MIQNLKENLSQAPDWRSELATNPRLRLGLVAVGIILIVSGLLWLGEQRNMAAAELAREQARHARLVSLADSDVWQQRRNDLASDRDRFVERFWRAPSQGQAQAEFQAWLMEQAGDYEFERLNISLVGMGPVAGAPEIWQVAMRLRARLDGDALAGLLEDLASHHQLVTVRSLRVQGGRRQRFDLETVAWFYGLGNAEPPS